MILAVVWTILGADPSEVFRQNIWNISEGSALKHIHILKHRSVYWEHSSIVCVYVVNFLASLVRITAICNELVQNRSFHTFVTLNKALSTIGAYHVPFSLP